MLKYNVRGENIEVTSALREYVEKKLSKLNKFFEDTTVATAHVNMKVYSDRTAKVEVTQALIWLLTNSNVKSESTRLRLTAKLVKRALRT